MKNFLLGLSLLGAITGFANGNSNTTILSACSVLSACTMQAGPYTEGTATVSGNRYVSNASNSTCCQLGGKIKWQICKDGLESSKVQVSCR